MIEGNEFYKVIDIMKQTGYCKSKCYDLINRLNEELKKDYPSIVTYKGRIQKKYWDAQFTLKQKEGN